jgi:hypothetical protein
VLGQPCHRRSHGRVRPRTTPVRLATSPAGREHVVLQGGLLLAHSGARRATRDIDILGQAFTANDTEITRRIRTIAATDVDDWVAFDSAILKTVPIRDDGLYHGLRLVIPASIARAQLELQLDISLAIPSPPSPSPSQTNNYWKPKPSPSSATHSPPSSPRN